MSFRNKIKKRKKNQMKFFTKNIQFYEYLGLGMGIDTQFLGYWVLGVGYGLGVWVIWVFWIGYGHTLEREK